jgi:hypothetical protein
MKLSTAQIKNSGVYPPDYLVYQRVLKKTSVWSSIFRIVQCNHGNIQFAKGFQLHKLNTLTG